MAQNIYESIGKKAEVLTLSNGQYQEIFPNDTLVRIGSVLFNTVTQEVVEFVEKSDADGYVSADVASRFLSVDPTGRKYPELTPYQFAGNTPIQAIDLDGLEGVTTRSLPRRGSMRERSQQNSQRQARTNPENYETVTYSREAQPVRNGTTVPRYIETEDGKGYIDNGYHPIPTTGVIRDPNSPTLSSVPFVAALQKSNYEHLQYQVAVDVHAAKLDDETYGDPKRGALVYISYTRTNPQTGKVYVGRTRGFGTVKQVLDDRYASDKVKTNEGFEDAVLDKVEQGSKSVNDRHSDPAYQAIRGREQLLIESLGGPTGRDGKRADKTRAANKINGIDPAKVTEYTLYTQESIYRHGTPSKKP